MAGSGKGGPRRGSAHGLPKAAGKGRGQDGRSATSGSGGYGRKRLEGKGPTPKAEERTAHPAARRAKAAAKAAAKTTSKTTSTRSAGGGEHRGPARITARSAGDTEHVAGRNSVCEALRAGVPATALMIAAGIDRDIRVTEMLKLAAYQGVPVLETTKPELDRLTDRAMHQGVVLRVPAYAYAHPADLVARAANEGEAALLVALDGVTDPRNLGAVVRSAAAFGGHGVLVPARRAAGMTASAWKTSAGAAARIPVAQATNLTRALREYAKEGLVVVGLDADGELSLDDLAVAQDSLVLVVGSEGKGLSRLVREACDVRVRIPLVRQVESLNAGVAAGIALAEVARLRRLAGRL
jgi:23S rRNA (guanosine2251-2'-O)-methyltransferase